MMKRGYLVVLLLVGASIVLPARADNFTFSFTNTVGTVSGTVTGLIEGLTDGTTGPATRVIITSFPAGLPSVVGSAPIDVTAWNEVATNSFTETLGSVTEASFVAVELHPVTPDDVAFLEINQPTPILGNIDYLILDNPIPDFVQSDQGLAGVTFKPAIVPEPASLYSSLTVFVAVALAVGKKRLRRSPPATET